MSSEHRSLADADAAEHDPKYDALTAKIHRERGFNCHHYNQRHINDLANSIRNLLGRGGAKGPGADLRSNAAIVLNDELDLSGKLASRLGSAVGGIAGKVLLPGLGGIIGAEIGSFFGRGKKSDYRDVQLRRWTPFSGTLANRFIS